MHFGYATDEVHVLLSGANAQGKQILVNHAQALESGLAGAQSLCVIPLRPDGVSGKLRLRIGLQRTRAVSFEAYPTDAARVARRVRSALAWQSVGETRMFETVISECLRQCRSSNEPITLAYLGLLCTVAPLPPAEFEPLAAQLKSLAGREPAVYAYQLALGATLLRANRPQDALPRLQELHKIEPSDGLIGLWYALALAETGQRQQAETILNSDHLRQWLDPFQRDLDPLMYDLCTVLKAEVEQRLRE